MYIHVGKRVSRVLALFLAVAIFSKESFSMNLKALIRCSESVLTYFVRF